MACPSIEFVFHDIELTLISTAAVAHLFLHLIPALFSGKWHFLCMLMCVYSRYVYYFFFVGYKWASPDMKCVLRKYAECLEHEENPRFLPPPPFLPTYFPQRYEDVIHFL